MKTRKICLVGDFGVGKTSLVRRYLSNTFSDRYLSTVGVKVETRLVNVAGAEHKLVIWDISGDNGLSSTSKAYLRGADGLVLVADLTRVSTFATLQKLKREATEVIGAKPFVVFLNKVDLESQRAVDPASVDMLRSEGWQCYVSSARTGEGVIAGFDRLAELVLQ